jgi:PTS system beta-glucosides-specific IIC component
MDYKQFGDDVVRLVGGKENVIGLEHCVTRLRFTLKDKSQADIEGLKTLKGVIGVVNGKQVQVVVGGEVVPAYNEIMKNYSFGGGTAPAAPKQKEKLTAKSALDALMDYISGTMVQIIPLFIGCGLVNCILSVAKIVFGVDSSTATYQVLNAVANAPFYYLPILVGYAAAKKLGANPFLGAMLGLFLQHPSLTALIGAEDNVFFGIPFSTIDYKSTVFPVLIGAWVLSYLEPLIYNHLPKVLKTIFGPFLCILIMSPLMLFVIGPVGYYFGQGLANAVLSLQHLPFGIGCGLVSALQPILVLFGAHTVLAPVMIESIGTVGFDALVRPAFIMASFSHFGASLAVTLKCKNKELKGMAAGVTLTSFLGTNEPSMYALEVPLVKPFIAALGGAFCGGVVSSLTGAKAYAMGKNGVFGWLVFEDTIVWIILASLVSAAVAFALAWVMGFDEKKLKV